MSQPIPKAEIAKVFLKTASTFRSNRCTQCGRRLKYQPGSFVNLTGTRFLTCRSCGFENLTLLEKVAENLSAAGYEIPDSDGGNSELGACLECGVGLLVSMDFTKVFCHRCLREWSVVEFEDILGGPLSPMLAGKMHTQPDNSKLAQELVGILEAEEIDYSNPYFVFELESVGSLEKDESFLKIMQTSWKEGVQEGKELRSKFNPLKRGNPKAPRDNGVYDSSNGGRTVENKSFVGIFSDYLARYDVIDGELSVQEVAYESLFDKEKNRQDSGLNLVLLNKKALDKFNAALADMGNIYLANKEPFKEVLFGSAKVKAEEDKNSTSDSSSIADELKKLAELNDLGILSADEFAAAKAKILGL